MWVCLFAGADRAGADRELIGERFMSNKFEKWQIRIRLSEKKNQRGRLQ